MLTDDGKTVYEQKKTEAKAPRAAVSTGVCVMITIPLRRCDSSHLSISFLFQVKFITFFLFSPFHRSGR